MNETVAQHRFEDLSVGMHATIERDITPHTVDSFAALTGDYNPLHTDETYAQSTRHGGRVAHGMLTASFVSAVIGMYLPGRRSLIVSEEMRFLLPVHMGDHLTIKGTVSHISAALRTITIAVVATRNAEEVMRGTVVTLVEDIV